MRSMVVVLSAVISASASAQPVAPPTSPATPADEPTQAAPAAPAAPEATPATPEPPVDPEIEKSMRIARSLAKDGHCDVALDYGKTIEAAAPAYYTRVFAADPYIAACIAGTAPQAKPPAVTPSVPAADDEEAPRTVCRRARFYLAPSLFVVDGSTYTSSTGRTRYSSTSDLFHRIAAGGLLRSCSRPQSFGGRIGATAVVSSDIGGFGLEAELDHGVAPDVRGGLRIGVEYGSDSRSIFSAGARVHLFDTVFLGVDAYRARDGSFTSHGVMFGGGLEGRAGRYVAASEAILFSLLVVAVLVTGGPAD